MFRKKKVKELNKNGQVLAITMGTIFGLGISTASMYTTYNLAEKLASYHQPVCEAGEEEEDD